jgi:hypothetical protein
MLASTPAIETAAKVSMSVKPDALRRRDVRATMASTPQHAR